MDGKKPSMVFTDPPYDMDKDTLISAYNAVRTTDHCVQFWMGSDRQQVWLTSNDIDNFSQFFVHDYKAATLVSNNLPMTQHNLISKFGKRKLNNLQDGFSTILRVSTLRGSIEHKNFTMGKRPELPFEFIIHYSNRGDIVLDVFGGSGSTLIAAQKAGRVCYMIEKSQKQCDMIAERYKKYTGKKVVRSCQ